MPTATRRRAAGGAGSRILGITIGAVVASLALVTSAALAGAAPTTTTVPAAPTTAPAPSTTGPSATTTVPVPPSTTLPVAAAPVPTGSGVKPLGVTSLDAQFFVNGYEWDFTNECGTSNGLPTGGVTSNGPGLSINDAATPASSDAFDCGAMVWVGNTAVADDDGIVDIGDQDPEPTITGSTVTIGGLQVTDSYRLFSSGDTARVLVELQNATAAPISTPVSYVSNFGSDASTVLAGSSSGDASFSTADRWTVTADDPTAGGDPINTNVFYGPGAVALAPASVSSSVFTAATPDGALATFDVTVPAGETRFLMFFQVITGGGNGTPNAAAVASAARWNAPLDLSSTLLAGVTAADAVRILNWSVSVPAAPAAAVGVIPTFAG